MENKLPQKIKVGFPHLGNYWVGFKEIAPNQDLKSFYMQYEYLE